MTTPSPEFAPWLGVFETLRVERGTPLFVAEHVVEIQRAAEALGLPFKFDVEAEVPHGQSGRWRWIATAEGTRTLFTEEEFSTPMPIEIGVSPVRVGSVNWDARFKTISYLTHAQARREAVTPEVVLLNEHGHVASGASSNIFWRRGERLFTPAHEAGCRCGVVRGFVLGHVEVEIGHFPLDDLLVADEAFLTNSMRGIVSVGHLDHRPLAFSTAERLRVVYDGEVERQLS